MSKEKKCSLCDHFRIDMTSDNCETFCNCLEKLIDEHDEACPSFKMYADGGQLKIGVRE